MVAFNQSSADGGLLAIGFDVTEDTVNQLAIRKGIPTANENLIPNFSAIKPSSGGAKRNARKDICASDATLTAAGRSVLWAAADMASGNRTALPAPINAKPSKAMAGTDARETRITPILIESIERRETFSAL